MKIVIAPDSYKGCLSALEVVNAMEEGILAVFPEAKISKVPIADGGEGTVEALVSATGGEMVSETVQGPIGKPITASWGLLGDGQTAVIEMAAASGLPLVPVESRNPYYTTTYGTGQLMAAALSKGIRKLIIGIGGSATNDGGAGMLQALGGRLLDKAGKELPYGGIALKELATIDLSGLDPRLAECDIMVACDVDNPLCGSRGASAVFGPQKGASPEQVASLDAALAHYAALAQAATGKDIAQLPGAGAAGGLGAGFLFFTSAKLRPGVEIILEATHFDDMVATASLVFTGEGRTDFQTAYGKAPVGVAKVAKRHGVPVICISGGLGQGAEDVLAQGIDGLLSVVPEPMPLADCMAQGADFVTAAAARACRLVQIGLQLK